MENGQNLIFSKNIKTRFSSDVRAVLNLTLALIVVSAIIVFILGKFNSSKPKSYTEKITFNQYQSYMMRQDEYPDGFPKDIIIKESGEWRRGEDTTIASTGERQLIVDLSYPLNVTDTIGVYNTIIISKGWVMNYKKDSFFIYEKNGASLTLTVVPMDGGSLVDLKYVAKITK